MRSCVIFLLLIICGGPVFGQSTEADLKSRLVQKKPLYLRGQWASDQLKFDSAGVLRGKADGFPFTICGVEIKSAKLGAKSLELDGNRVALIFSQNNISRQRMEKLRIQIETPTSGDYGSALDRIFTSNLADFVPTLPSYWQVYSQAHFLPGAADSIAPKNEPEFKKIGGAVSPPKVLSAKTPAFPDYARNMRIAGHVLVYLQVDAQGNPGHIRIVKPLGAGLDEQAVRAVAQYKFKPAEQNGTPIPVEMNVDVAFDIF